VQIVHVALVVMTASFEEQNSTINVSLSTEETLSHPRTLRLGEAMLKSIVKFEKLMGTRQ
jgi:hypothetical protein